MSFTPCKFDIRSDAARLEAKNQFDGNLAYGAKKFHADTARSGKGRPASGYIVPAHAEVVQDTGSERYERRHEFWEAVDQCPVCHSSDRHHFLHRFGIDVVRCEHCGHRYQNPRIRFDKATELYSNDASPAKVYNSVVQKDIDRYKYHYGLSLVEQLSPLAKNKIMDIGCGAGGLLFEAEREGWQQCVGVDINERWTSNFSDQNGVQFINSTFESLDPKAIGKNYSAITMWNVLEHIYDIHQTVASIKTLLAERGLFVVMVPNVESLASRIIREKSPTFNWKHVSHFCINSLNTLMTKHGFNCVHQETVISEIDNIKSYLSGEYPYHGFGDPSGFFDFITPEYIHDNMLGSRILAIYQK